MKAIPSRADPSKWGCSQCDYGHDVGKSRNGVYKHFKKAHEGVESEVVEVSAPSDYVQTDEIPVEDSDDSFTKSDGTDWGSVDWEETDNAQGPDHPQTVERHGPRQHERHDSRRSGSSDSFRLHVVGPHAHPLGPWRDE